VIVIETIRIRGSASAAMSLSVSSGAMMSIIGAVTRAAVLLLSCSTTVVRKSCAASLSRIRASDGITTGANDRPVQPMTLVEQVIKVDSLMGAVKVANPEMEDAGRQHDGIIGRNGGRMGDLTQCR
jgi:hypothetical protein